ncbi:MAG: hypothetical protein ACI9KE_006088 [Polyangiales bacterium]
MADQNTRLREAIDLLGRSDYSEAAIPIPMESSASNVTRSGHGRLPPRDSAIVPLNALELSASDVMLLDGEGEGTNKRKALVLATLIAAILLGAILAVVLATPDPETPNINNAQNGALEPSGEATPEPEAPVEANSETPIPLADDGDVENDPVLEPDEDESGRVESETSVSRRNGRNGRSHMRQRANMMNTAPAEMVESAMVADTTSTPEVVRPTRMTPVSSSMMNDLELNPYR